MSPIPLSRSRVVVALVVALLSLAATTLAAYVTTTRYMQSTEAVAHTYEVITVIEQLQGRLAEAEAGQRGYIISGDERHLARYRDGTRGALAAFGRLGALTRDNPRQQARIDALAPVLDRRLDALGDALAARRLAGPAAAERLVAAGPGRALMADIRRRTDDIRAEEDGLLRRRVRAEHERARRARLVMFAAFASAFAIAGLAAGVILREMSERARLEGQLRQQALADELTGLPNRRAFTMVARERIRLMRRLKQPLVLFFLDLDRFKEINDTFGHDAGDSALRDVAYILRETFRDADLVARLGGDEFAVLAVEGSEDTEAVVRQRLAERLDAFNASGRRGYRLATSVGAARLDAAAGDDLEALLERADAALYEEKRVRRGGRAA